ncbi:MAG: hypothetical protein JXB49_37515 [Bacteroidales bacterium]|nr:hypothetical protein [Bacteroidales bacterium]
MIDNLFSLTLLVIIVSSLIAAYIRRKHKDRCLKDFNANFVTVLYADNQTDIGVLSVTGSGMQVRYEKEVHLGNNEKYIGEFIYKSEFSAIKCIIRHVDKLHGKQVKSRERQLKYIYKPTFLMRVVRALQNFFKTIRDSLVDVIQVLVGRSIKNANLLSAMQSQNKYVTQVNQQLASMVEAAYEPLLEKNIGKRVEAILDKGEKPLKLRGILKEYTSEFIELLDVKCIIPLEDDQSVDVIFPRNQGMIRYILE